VGTTPKGNLPGGREGVVSIKVIGWGFNTQKKKEKPRASLAFVISFESQGQLLISFSRSLLPSFIKKRPTRLRLEIVIIKMEMGNED